MYPSIIGSHVVFMIHSMDVSLNVPSVGNVSGFIRQNKNIYNNKSKVVAKLKSSNLFTCFNLPLHVADSLSWQLITKDYELPQSYFYL